MNTFADTVFAHAQEQPNARACAFVDESGTEKAVLTYGALHRRAVTVATHLQATCQPGDRAILLFPPGLDVVAAYLGCLYAGVIAVPVNPPRRGRVRTATPGVVADCRPAAVLTVQAVTAAAATALGNNVPAGVRWIEVDALSDVERPDAAPYPSAPDSVALLQYTSGSTAVPKGVMVTHGNLVANQEMIRRAFGHGRDSIVVGWVPHFHDQGLIGNIMQPLHLGSSCVLMSPMTFLRRPLLWLTVVSRYRAHTSGGPNFAFDACAERVRPGDLDGLDLSCWEVAFNGAEPVRPATLRRFADTLAPAGFRASALFPCYGLAESTLLVTGSGKARGPLTATVDAAELGRGRWVPTAAEGGRVLAGSGAPAPGVTVRIVDPDTGATCPDGTVGEIRVAGPNVTAGYWERPDATEATYVRDDDGVRYLRTGDLGVLADGELYAVGRIKDVIVVRGRNIYPQDVELTAELAHPAVRAGFGAAFATHTGDGSEGVVLLVEVDRSYRGSEAELAQAVRQAVTRGHDIALVALVLVTAGQIPRTSSGKIRRAEAARLHATDALRRWTAAAPRQAVGARADAAGQA